MKAEPAAAVYIAPLPDIDSTGTALVLARDIRSYGVSCVVDGRSVKLKRKMQAASDMQSYFAVIAGPDDLASRTVQVRDMDERTQAAVPLKDATRHIALQMFSEPEVLKIEDRQALAKFGRS